MMEREPDAITEDDLAKLRGLALAIETCSDVMIGLIDESTARRALPTLIELQQAEIERLQLRVCEVPT